MLLVRISCRLNTLNSMKKMIAILTQAKYLYSLYYGLENNGNLFSATQSECQTM